jgi:hypothetical protein
MAANVKRGASEDWPYENEEPMHVPGPGLYWECPDGTCECGRLEEGELRESRVLLTDELGMEVPGARCRVLHAGRVLNEDAPYADAEGWLTVTVRYPLRTVTLEWAPPELPRGRGTPFAGATTWTCSLALPCGPGGGGERSARARDAHGPAGLGVLEFSVRCQPSSDDGSTRASAPESAASSTAPTRSAGAREACGPLHPPLHALGVVGVAARAAVGGSCRAPGPVFA